MYGLITIGSILLFAYLIALGLSAKSEKDLLKERGLRQKDQEEHKKEIAKYEMEIMNLLTKGA